MKKAILILSLIAVSISTYAGIKRDTTKVKAKTDTVKKKSDTVKKEAVKPAPAPKQFQLDPFMVYHIQLDMNGQQIVALTGFSDGSIEKTPKITKDDIENYRDEAKFLNHIIRDQEIAQQQAAYKQWAADTAAKVKVDTLKLKVKKVKAKGKKPATSNVNATNVGTINQN